MRLIDADALMEALNKSDRDARTEADIQGYCDGWNDVVEIINEQPTAYDVEKVIHKIDETLFEFGAGNNCTRCAFREVCDDGNDGCIETMAEVFRNTVRMGGVL